MEKTFAFFLNGAIFMPLMGVITCIIYTLAPSSWNGVGKYMKNVSKFEEHTL